MKNVYEVFAEFENAPTKETKIDVLRRNGNFAVKSVLQGTYSPAVQFIIEEIPNFKKSDAPPGLGYSNMTIELKRAYLFEKNNPNVSPSLSMARRKQILIQILESLEAKEAEVFMNMLLKKQNVKGLDAKIVKEAFPDLIP